MWWKVQDFIWTGTLWELNVITSSMFNVWVTDMDLSVHSVTRHSLQDGRNQRCTRINWWTTVVRNPEEAAAEQVIDIPPHLKRCVHRVIQLHTVSECASRIVTKPWLLTSKLPVLFKKMCELTFCIYFPSITGNIILRPNVTFSNVLFVQSSWLCRRQLLLACMCLCWLRVEPVSVWRGHEASR